MMDYVCNFTHVGTMFGLALMLICAWVTAVGLAYTFDRTPLHRAWFVATVLTFIVLLSLVMLPEPGPRASQKHDDDTYA